jgi:hypothetical protein
MIPPNTQNAPHSIIKMLFIALGPQQLFRLVGVGISNFLDPEEVSAQPALFG